MSRKFFGTNRGRICALFALVTIVAGGLLATQDYPIPVDAGDSMSAMRNKMNRAFETLRSNFSGDSPPTDPAPVYGQLWYEGETDTFHGYFNTGTGGAGWYPLLSFNSITAGPEQITFNHSGLLAGIPLGTSNQILGMVQTIDASHQYEYKTVQGTADEISVSHAANSITIGIVDPLTAAKGGTGASSLTDGGLLVGGGTGAVTALSVATNGQIPIGDGTTAPVLGTITAGSGITVTNGAGSITVGADPYREITTKYTKTHADLTDPDNGDSQTISITIPAKTLTIAFFLKPSVAFSGGGVASLTLDADSSYFGIVPVTAFDLLAPVSDTNITSSALHYEAAKSMASYTIDFTITPDGAHNLADLSAGSIDIFITTRLLNL